jgi:hypothetical protein
MKLNEERHTQITKRGANFFEFKNLIFDCFQEQ